MEDRIIRLEEDMVEMRALYTKVLEELEALKAEDTTGGIILDGCNDDVIKYITSTKKEGE